MRVSTRQSKRLARYNRLVILDLIRRHGPIAKAELSERSGLAVSSVVNVVAWLLGQGLIRSVGPGPSSGGRPPTLVELEPHARYAIGVTVRRNDVEGLLLDFRGDVVAEVAFPVPGAAEPHSIHDTVVDAVNQVIQLAHVDRTRVLGLGVGLAGLVSDTGVVAWPGLPAWQDIPFADQLHNGLALPVTVENDANLGALAEYQHEARTRNHQWTTLVYVQADYGIGEGIVIDGKLYRGVDGLAGQLGHVVIDVDGRRCSCGNYGCLEALASVGSIIHRAVLAAKLGSTTSLSSHVHGNWDSINYATVMEAVAERDPVATAAVDEAIAYLAVGISTVIQQFRPEVIVLGGEMFDRRPEMLEALRSAVVSRPSVQGTIPTRLMMAALGSRAPAIGAATLVLDNYFGVPEQEMRYPSGHTGTGRLMIGLRPERVNHGSDGGLTRDWR